MFYSQSYQEKIEEITARVMELGVEPHRAKVEAEHLMETNGEQYRNVYDIAGTFLKHDAVESQEAAFEEAKSVQLSFLHMSENEIQDAVNGELSHY
jgi:hypothetical protein